VARSAVEIVLSAEERKLLVENTRPSVQHRFVQRARVVLLAADGFENGEIAGRVGISFVAVCKWRQRYARHGIVGLKDKAGRGRPKRLTHDQMLKVVEVACKKPGDATHWSVRRLAQELGFVKKSRLQQLLKGFDLKPHQFEMWCFSNDPRYEQKKADIVGLYLDPPKNAFVVCIDEKPGIQALSRKRLPMAPGHAEKFDHEYKRNGTVDLFAAFRVNDGKVIGKVEQRHRAVEFLSFMKTVYRKWGRKGRKLHIVLDNLNTHEVEEVQAWLSEHKNVQFHFTPTHASWLNQIEMWFSIIERQLLHRGSFENVRDISTKILDFIEQYNKHAKQFAWCYGQPLKI
jgi:putative transposase